MSIADPVRPRFCEKILSCPQELTFPTLTSCGDIRRPTKPVRADNFDDDDVFEDDGALFFGWNLLPPKVEVQFTEEVACVVPEVSKASALLSTSKWTPPSKFLEELHSSINSFNSKVMDDSYDKYDMLLKQYQYDPTMDNYLGQLSKLWKDINSVEEGMHSDDNLLMDYVSIVEAEKEITKSEAITEMINKIRKDHNKARKKAKEHLNEIEFVPETTKKKPLSLSVRKVHFNGNVDTKRIQGVNLRETEQLVPTEAEMNAISVVSSTAKLYKNIPGVVVRTISVNEERKQPTSVLKRQMLSESNIGNVKRSKILPPVPKEDLQPETSIAPVQTQKGALGRNSFATAMSYEFDDDYMLVDNDSDGDSDDIAVVYEPSNENLFKCIPWELRALNLPKSSTKTHETRFRIYNLPPLSADDVAKKPIKEFNEIPPIPLVAKSVVIKRKNNEDRCVFLELGLKSRDIRTLALYDREYKGLSIADQQRYNACPALTEQEIHYAENHVIQQYGSVPVNNFKYPTADPFEGLYWPIFQPIDDIPIGNETAMVNADVQNQLVNQTVCNYVAKKLLLCDDGSGFWNATFAQASTSGMNLPPPKGRFKNRICFARNIPSIDISNRNSRAKEIDREQNEEYRRQIEEQKEIQKREFLLKHDIKEADTNDEGFLAKEEEYNEICLSTRLNDQLLESQRDKFSLAERSHKGRRKFNPYPSHWFEVPFKQYVPANDRRTFLCKYVNHYNDSIIKQLPIAINKDTANKDNFLNLVAEWILQSFPAIFAMQYDVEGKFLHFGSNGKTPHLELAKNRKKKLDTLLPKEAIVKISDLKELCKMQSWEWEYWPLIWDSLGSIYKKLPPVSHLVPLITDVMDKAFINVAQLPLREEYYSKYTEIKQDYLDSL